MIVGRRQPRSENGLDRRPPTIIGTVHWEIHIDHAAGLISGAEVG